MTSLLTELDRAWIKLNAALNDLFEAARSVAVHEGTIVSVRIETDKNGKPKNGIARATINSKKWRAILRWEQEP